MVEVAEITPADVIAELLIAQGKVGDPGSADELDWPIYVNNLPESPVECLGIYDQEGVPVATILQTGVQVGWDGFQIIAATKEESFRRARQKLVEVAKYFEGIRSVGITVDEEQFQITSVQRTNQNPLPLGKEETTRRTLFALNFLTRVTKVA